MREQEHDNSRITEGKEVTTFTLVIRGVMLSAFVAGVFGCGTATGWAVDETPVAAAGLQVVAFARELVHPRCLYVLPNGDVLVAETRAVFIAGLNSPFGMALVGNTFYVANTDALVR